MLKKIIDRLRQMNQFHLAQGLEDLFPSQQTLFLEKLQPDLLNLQRTIFQSKSLPIPLQPITHADTASKQWAPAGLKKLSQGKVACLILAGGQGSRLNSPLPKALIPITKNKTLLELQLEKLKNIPCAILTSPSNHSQIADFLKNRPFTPILIQQTEAPFLDKNQNWILREPGQLASGPDGNGHALHHLKAHGLLRKWEKEQIEILTIIPIDNVLADPIDPILIGYHTGDVTVKVVLKENPEEKMGMMVYKEGKVAIQEYSELATNQQGTLAHTGLFALSLSFAQHAAQFDFPWHFAHKQDPVSKQWIWKFERLILDMLDYSQKTNLLLYPSKSIYAPLKEEKNLATVQQALQNVAKESNYSARGSF